MRFKAKLAALVARGKAAYAEPVDHSSRALELRVALADLVDVIRRAGGMMTMPDQHRLRHAEALLEKTKEAT